MCTLETVTGSGISLKLQKRDEFMKKKTTKLTHVQEHTQNSFQGTNIFMNENILVIIHMLVMMMMMVMVTPTKL
jgi:hypothetical protein